MMTIESIATIAHEANRAYCQTIGDDSQPPWGDAPQWQRDSAIQGVRFHMANPDAGPEGSHKSWMDQKIADGWVYGEVKDAEAKTHPCMVDYHNLPDEQQAKDYLFTGIVHALARFVPPTDSTP